MRFELHCHSTCSDGTEPPERVAARAAERGVLVLALTDHDSCEGSARARAAAEEAGAAAGAAARGHAPRAIRGVELSCDDGGRTIHVLAYDRGGDWAILEERLRAVRTARKNRLRVMGAKLVTRGVRIDLEPLLADAERRSVGRPDLARAMVAVGAATSVRDAFARHLYDDGPVDVPHRALPIDEALALGRAAGAAMALAHPHLYDARGVALLRRWRDAGLDGVEAFHGAYDARERERWIALAGELGLTCTGGSDWHGPEEAIAQPGVDLPPDRSAALLRWLGA
ncbi:MAG TPA: PHP domain-containing protein [Kofleriaceae bacterium]|nr:PHP domain-containing protein [Kofleriaceae bacterium]